MNVVWFSWKDIFHPQAGGAETMTDMALSALVQQGHTVTLLTASYPGSEYKPDVVSGYRIRRTGGRWSVYIRAWILYFDAYQSSDVVVDEINAIPFAAPLLLPRKKVITFVHHISRNVWLYQIFFPINILGFLLEPIYYYMLAWLRKPIITVSQSTQSDLLYYGVRPENIFITTTFHALTSPIGLSEKKYDDAPTVLVVGSIRPMKRTLHAVQAFEIVAQHIPNCKLILAGSHEGSYGRQVCQYVEKSKFRNQIVLLGFVDEKEKQALMRSLSVLALTSVREGWCLVATEAHSQGLPTVVYDVHGLRDSTQHNVTGLVVDPNPIALAEGLINILQDTTLRQRLSTQALTSGSFFTLERAQQKFLDNFNAIIKL